MAPHDVVILHPGRPPRAPRSGALTDVSLLLVAWILTLIGLSTTESAFGSPASIGVATMERGGTIILQLQANDGIHGHARLVYPPTHPEYADILKHLDGLKPGESKPVPPWPDPVSSPARSSDSSR